MSNIKTSTLFYKGFEGRYYLDPDINVYFGRVSAKDVVTFQSDDITTIEQAFQDSVDDYLDFCDTSNKNEEV